jgi:hypothetical protein
MNAMMTMRKIDIAAIEAARAKQYQIIHPRTESICNERLIWPTLADDIKQQIMRYILRESDGGKRPWYVPSSDCLGSGHPFLRNCKTY